MFLLSLTRPIVLPLVLVVSFHAIVRWRSRDRDPFPRRERAGLVAATIGLALSFGIWPLIGWLRTGTPNAYTDSIGSWSRTLNQQQGYVSWVTDAFTGHWISGNCHDCGRLGSSGFCYSKAGTDSFGRPNCGGGVCPMARTSSIATRPQSSFMRHAMLAIVPWWPFPEVGEQVRSRREQVLLASLAGALGLVGSVLLDPALSISPGPHFLPTGFP